MREKIKVWVQDKGDGSNLRLQWRDLISGDRRTVTAGTKNEKKAWEKASDLEQRLNAGGSTGDYRMTWDEFEVMFLDEHAGAQRQKSQDKYRCVFTVWKEIVSPKRLIAAATTDAIWKFIKGMRVRKVPGKEEGLAPWTQRNYLVALKTAFRWAATKSLIPRVPVFPKIKVPKRRPQPVPQEDFDKLLEQAPDDTWRAYMLCGWYEGLRLAEALLIRWKCNDDFPWLDLAHGRIHLPAGFQKNGEDDWLPLHPVVAEALAKVPRIEGEDRVFAFRSRMGGGYLTRNGMSNRIILMARRAGVKLSMHRLRKGFGCRVASQLGKGNAPILHRLMRHSSMQVTMDFYASVDDSLTDVMKELK